MPPAFEPWTDQDDAKLEELERSDFLLRDTQLGRLEAQCQLEFEGSVASMPKEQAAAYLEQLQQKILGENDKVSPSSDEK